MTLLPSSLPPRVRDQGQVVDDPVKAAMAEMAQRELARKRLLPFIVRNVKRYKAGWVHKVICRELEIFSEQVANEESPRLIIEVPPRHGKSEIVSRNFPAFHLGRYPHHEIIATSYGADLARGFSRKVRELLKDDGYGTIFPDVGLDPGAQNLDHWLLDGHDGGYAAAGVGGPITGKGMHVGIIDDYVKNSEEADSETARNSLWNWYESTFKSRLAPGGGIIVMATRWHEDDLIGRILEDEGTIDEGGVWKEIKFPAEALQDERYRKKGEALHPERYDNAFFDQFRKNPRVWWSLYQQSPVVEDGDYFKNEDFRYYKTGECPPLEEMTIYCAGDFAVGTREANDFTVFTVVGVDRSENIYVLDVFRLKADSSVWVDKLFEIHDAYKPDLFVFEKGQISLAVEPFLLKRIEEEKRWTFAYECIPTGRRDKQARARSIQGRMKQHKVFIPRMHVAPWVKDWLDELKKFPNGKHDDQVDSLAYIGLGMDKFYTQPEAETESNKKSWRDRIQESLNSSSTGSTHMSA